MERGRGLSLVEVLVVVAVLAVLAALLFPVFIGTKNSFSAPSKSNLRQIGLALEIYLGESDGRYPDRRDLKAGLPGGYRPWTGWPASDPRTGWALIVLHQYVKSNEVWHVRAGHRLARESRVVQPTPLGESMLWMWRFDRSDDPVPLDNFWGKTQDQCVRDLIEADNPVVGLPTGVSDVELVTEPYFPKTIALVPPELKGQAVYPGGRHQLMLDGRVKFLKDRRLD